MAIPPSTQISTDKVGNNSDRASDEKAGKTKKGDHKIRPEVAKVGPIVFLDGELKYWSWSPYDKCSFRCVYCSVEAQGKSKPALKPEDVPALLDEFVKYRKHFALCVGGSADAYPAEEAEFRLMRTILPEITQRNIYFTLVTHGDLLARDIDLLVGQSCLGNIGVSIPHHDDAQAKRFEPGSPSFQSKVDAVLNMHAAGLPVHVNISPWIPGITDVATIASAFPEDMLVNVGVLSYNAHHRDAFTRIFGREVPSAQRVFGDQFSSQAVLNQAYLEAQQKIGSGPRGNLKWLIPPGTGKNFTHYLPDP